VSGGGGTTTTQTNSPPQQYLDAYSQVMNQATGVAKTPYQNYPGQLQAGFSPMQQQGFDVIGSAPGVQAPYLNAAAQDFANANAPLAQTMQPYVNQAQQGYQNVQNANLQGALTPFQQQAQQGFAAGSQQLTPQQYSGAAIQQYESPYTQSVVNATQNQFNNQNAQQQTQLRGNAASQGALGGDRLGVAQGVLAGQQQSAQAPVIAGLENQGFQTAQQEFNTQQQTNLTAQQQSEALQQQAAQGYAGLGGQSLTAAQQQAALQAQAAQGFGALGQSELGAAQAQGWLGAQTGAGMAGLGNEALTGTIQSGNALLGAGAQQQAQAQTALNIPYQQWQAQLAYPYQTTGWLANIAEGLGGSSGGTGSTTYPGPSVGSQIAGAGLGAAGLVGATGGFGSNGWLTSALSGGGGSGAAATDALAGLPSEFGYRRGGNIGGFATGGSVPAVMLNGMNVAAQPGGQVTAPGGFGVPDVSASVVPAGAGGNAAHSIQKQSFPTTTTTGPAPESALGAIVKDAASIAANVYAPGSGIAVNYGLSAAGLARGGQIRGFDAGGATDVPGSADVTALGADVPNVGHTFVPAYTVGAHGTFGMPKPPPAQKPENLGQETMGWLNDLKSAGLLKNPNQTQTSARGGSVPILPHGFAAGGAPAINVATVPNAKGFGVPTMTVDPSVIGSGGSAGTGSPSSQMNAYLAQQAAGAYHPPATPAAAPASSSTQAPSNNNTASPVSASELINELGPLTQAAGEFPGDSRGGRIHGFGAGGFIRGFADGGDTPAAAYDPAMFAAGQFLPPDTDTRPTEADTPAPDAPAPDAPPPPDDDPPDLVPQSVRERAAAHQDTPDPAPPVEPASKGFGADVMTGDLPPGMAGVARPDEVAESPSSQRLPPTPREGHLDAMFADALSRNRALKEDHANPWMALAQAGFGMMAGTSPHAGTNIGQGAVYGLSQYVSADRAAKDLAAKVDESRARLMEAQQYHQDAVDARRYGIDTRHQDAQDRIANALQMATIKAMNQLGRGLTNAEAERSYVETLTKPTDQGGLGMSLPDAIEAAKGYAGRAARQQQSVNQRGDAQNALQNYRNAVLDGRAQTTEETRRWHDYLISKGATDEDIRFYGLNRDLANNPTLTPEQAHQGAGKLRGLNTPGGTAAPPAPAPTLPMALPERQDALVTGKTYATSRGPAVWDGTQFMPVQ
jgi:hypothetical protein